jgi:hypothetical protein
VIKVFVGGHHANQSVPFAAAFQMLSEKYNNKLITPHYLFVKDIRENKLWDEKTIVDWLLDGDAHFILTHIHQGLENIIKVNLLKKNLLRLSAHPGFPTRLQITCPIFTQDKGRYLTAIKDIICPTYLFSMNPFPEFNNLQEYIFTFPALVKFLNEQDLGLFPIMIVNFFVTIIIYFNNRKWMGGKIPFSH